MSRTRRNPPPKLHVYPPDFQARMIRGLVPWPAPNLENCGEVWTPKSKRWVKATRNRITRRTFRLEADQ